MQFKVMIITNPLYTQEQRNAAVKLMESIDQDLENSGPYEPSDVTEELLEAFNKSLCEFDENPEVEAEEGDPDDDAGTKKSELLEGFDDTSRNNA